MITHSEALERIRKIRGSKDLRLKPSPFLKNKTDEGEEIKLRNYQSIGVMNLLQCERQILADDCGLGKAQPTDSQVLTPDGWRKIGSLKVDDLVIGSRGTPIKVTGVFPQGIKQAYRVTMSDGASTECCDRHLWTVRDSNTRRTKKGWKTISLQEIIDSGIRVKRSSKHKEYRWGVPVPDPIEFSEKSLPIDPYLMGVLLGDGSISHNSSITNGDPELFDLAESRFPEGCKYGKNKKEIITKSIIGTESGFNPIRRAIKELGLKGKNWENKFIPKIYLESSIEQRIELLRGLIDTDGYVSKDGKVTQFFSSNLRLVEDFTYLIRSLGGISKYTSKVPVLRGKSRAKRGRLAYTVTISLPNDITPYHLSRKKSRWVPRTKYLPSRRIVDISPSRIVDCVCIKVDSEDSLYVTDDFILTHNTLQVTSTLGYVWMKEPSYVFIVITTKSALFQWESEIKRFMSGMDVIVVSGDPFERHSRYKEFFHRHSPEKRRVLLLTYDHIMRDMSESVIKDKSKKPDPKLKKELKTIKEKRKELDKFTSAEREILSDYFKVRPDPIQDHARNLLQNGGISEDPNPKGWILKDIEVIRSYLSLKEKLEEHDHNILKISNQINPPSRVNGISDYVRNLKDDFPDVKIGLVMDEMHKVKNHKSQFHEKVKLLSNECSRLIGMTATPIKNRLMEFFSLFRIIDPNLFPRINQFQNEFCVMKMQPIGGGRQVPVVVGYRNLDSFVERIEPYYLSRKKHDVATELPALISRDVECELTDDQEEIYDMAESGILNKSDDPDISQADMLSSLTACMQAADSPQLITNQESGVPFEGKSSKVEWICDFLSEEAQEKKVIVFSKFEKFISIIGKELSENKIKFLRITGKENDPKLREKNKKIFQDPDSGYNVILITMAGSESINLQAAEHFIYSDLPWSLGDYLQLNGRMVRIGSSHNVVTAHHLLSRKQNGDDTIDHHILKSLKLKKKLFDKVAGDSMPDGLINTSNDDIRAIFEAISNGVDKSKVKKVIKAKENVKIEVKPEKPTKLSVMDIDISDI
jgi:superfamily II DNA or RNA helicase